MRRGTLRSSVPLGRGGEFDLIRAMLAELPDPAPEARVRIGPGDDCAVLEAGGDPWAVTVDMSVEDVHFRRAWLDPEEIGWRASTGALSDLAAVAAEPVAVLVALAMPVPDASPEWVKAVTRGAAAAASSVGAVVVGGDLTRSSGPVVIDVAALGRAPHPVLREGSRPGDDLWVTGLLGAAGAAVRAWESGTSPLEAHRRAFARPVPRVAEARWLAGTGAVRTLVDLSDGLAGDTGHLAAASRCGAVLDEAAIPVAPGVADAAGGWAEGLRIALSAGEDYELCLAVEPGGLTMAASEFQARFGIPLTRVGRIVEGDGVLLERADGSGVCGLDGGYSHFGKGTG